MLFIPDGKPIEPLRDATPGLGDFATLRAWAEEFGYLYLPQFVPVSAAGAVRACLREFGEARGWFLPDPANGPEVLGVPGRQLTGRGFDDPDWLSLQQMLHFAEPFKALGTMPPVLEVLATLYDAPARTAASNICWVKFPGSPQHTTLPHQDRYYLTPLADLWTAWYPLVETPMEVGPLAVVPGSNHGELWPHASALLGIETPPDTPWATGPFSPGDVLLFHNQTVHAAWSNVSADHVRLSADVRFLPASTPMTLL